MPASGVLIQRLFADGLVDQLDRLSYPVVVGQGTGLFADTDPDIALELVTSRTTSRGITIQTLGLLGAHSAQRPRPTRTPDPAAPYAI